jgi:quinol monooxygenase YgiN
MSHPYHVVLVNVQVTPEAIGPFQIATLINAAASLEEPGVVRFDVVQEVNEPTRFVLIEVYHDLAGAAAHKQTAHYQIWRDTVAPMMFEPRSSRSFVSATPLSTWSQPRPSHV